MSDPGRICRHYGTCGGCRYQDIPYSEQVAAKEAECRGLFSSWGAEGALLPAVPSPSPYFYRNKMEFSFAGTAADLICGLHRRDRRRELFDLEECLIFSEKAPAVVGTVREFARRSGLSAHSCFTHRGFWRNLVVRETKFTNQLLINLVTTSSGDFDGERLAGLLAAALPPGTDLSLLHTINDRPGDAVVPDSVALLAGKGYLVEEVEGLKFKIPPFSFFQVNPRAVAGFYRVLRDLPPAADPGMVLDLFCGIGPISLLLAPRAREVVGVEMDGAAVETARENAVLNGAGNVEFIAGDARKVLYERRENWTGRFGLLVVNPPRSGIGKKVLKRIRELRPPFILYSSCNPRTFSEQAEGLFDDYRPVLGRPFDFFPHTPHQELLALFERRREEKP